jgi:hypothetical protein
MNPLMFYIPTRGRVDNQLTLRSLPKEWRERTTLVCPQSEVKAHTKNWPDLESIWAFDDVLYKKRAFIFRTTQFNKIMMLDDDLTFHLRIGKKLVTPPPDHRLYGQRFRRVEKLLDKYRHGGISIRFMNNAVPEEYKENSKALHTLGYDVGTVLGYCELGRIKYAHDYDYTLQLLRAGFENFIYYDMATNEPRGQGAPGGLSYKKEKEGLACLHKLAKLHPGIVDVKIKDDGRAAMTVRWKKAIKEGLAK